MQGLRWVFLLLLLGAAGCFGFYAATGQIRFKTLGLRILKWTVSAALFFFAVLIVQRMVS